MTTNEATAAAGRTATTIRNWIARGRLAASIKQTDGPPGFAWYITPEALAVRLRNLTARLVQPDSPIFERALHGAVQSLERLT